MTRHEPPRTAECPGGAKRSPISRWGDCRTISVHAVHRVRDGTGRTQPGRSIERSTRWQQRDGHPSPGIPSSSNYSVVWSRFCGAPPSLRLHGADPCGGRIDTRRRPERPPDRRRLQTHPSTDEYVDIMSVRDGRIVQHWNILDQVVSTTRTNRWLELSGQVVAARFFSRRS